MNRPVARRPGFALSLGLALGLTLGLAFGLGGCNWLTGTRRGDQPEQGVILKVNQHKAALYINDTVVTLLTARKPNVIGLEPGRYRIAVKKAGFFTRYFDVTVTRKRFERLEASLPPELD